MKPITIFIFAGIACLFLFCECSGEKDHRIVKRKAKTCKDLLSDLTKRQMKGIAKCTKKLEFKTPKEKQDRINCVLKCVMIDEGILSPEGLFNKESVIAFIDREAPAGMEDQFKELFGTCIDQAQGIDPEEFLCKTYAPMIKCFMSLIPKLCPSKKG